ncbi:MAG: AAA family ATPase [Firmicutes bacterium]|nr:AAA family ATPase [Bacillota bacterium]
MDLFSVNLEKHASVPLAYRMRPRSLDEFVGQEHIVGPGRLLRRAIEADQVQSAIFYGPPGSGKTALAMVISQVTAAEFVRINAVSAGVREIKEIIDQARDRLKYEQRRTILFIDEIHRFNKAQQDALLPAVENGTVVMIGATTENPFFEVNSALLSRSRLYVFHQLKDEEVEEIVKRALRDEERGLGLYTIRLDDEALQHLIRAANGDARNALNALEMAVLTTPPENGVRQITLAIIEEALQQRMIPYDQSGDNHYDAISAFIKSMRGSDPQASLYWLARMLKAGEDPKFIARRLMIHAAEDVGLADPRALLVATAAAQAVERVGLPEGRIILAEAALYIALAPKSNSVVMAIDAAMDAVERLPNDPVPPHLRDASYRGAKALGHGQGYKYPHNYPGHWVDQQYLPAGLQGMKFYVPSDQGEEKDIKLRR